MLTKGPVDELLRECTMASRRSVVRNLIVGVDGTEPSLGALSWAVETVGHEGRIHAVVAMNRWTEHLVNAVTSDPVDYRDVVEAALVDEWTNDAGFAVGELVTSVSAEPMASALERAATADRADAIVVGAHSGIGGVLKRVGHSTNRLMQMTQHPVVVVPTESVGGLNGGRVVVGIGHGDATRSAVRWAAHLARTRRVSIELLHAMGDAPVFQADGVLDLARYEFGGTEGTDWEVGQVEHFAELMQTLVGRELDVAISTPPGLPALRLDEASENSSLLVIGRHRSKLDGGRHSAQPLRHALTHARCAVAVIPDHPVNDVEIDDAANE